MEPIVGIVLGVIVAIHAGAWTVATRLSASPEARLLPADDRSDEH